MKFITIDAIFLMSSFINLPEFSQLNKKCTELNLSRKNLTSLEGIEQFQKLKKLYCNGNQITSLDNLPSGLQILYCYNNRVTSLDNLPSGLQKLYCNGNHLPEEYKGKTLEEIHQLNRDKKLNKLKRNFLARKIQKVWFRYWYLELVDGEVRYIRYLKKKIPLLL